MNRISKWNKEGAAAHHQIVMFGFVPKTWFESQHLKNGLGTNPNPCVLETGIGFQSEIHAEPDNRSVLGSAKASKNRARTEPEHQYHH
jgi:hypothetical protein